MMFSLSCDCLSERIEQNFNFTKRREKVPRVIREIEINGVRGHDMPFDLIRK